MGHAAGFLLAHNDGPPSLWMVVAVTFSAAAAIVGLLGRRRLPAGLGEGTLVAGGSAAVIVLAGIASSGGATRPAVGHVLVGLVVLWYALAQMGVRGRPSGLASGRGGDDETERAGWRVLAGAALVCGLAGVVRIVATGGFSIAAWTSASVDLAVLLLLSIVICAFRSERRAAYPVLALTILLVALAVPASVLRGRTLAVGVALCAAGALSLLVVIAVALLGWRRRRRLWLENPQRPLEPPREHNILFVTLIGVSVLVGFWGVLLREAMFAPPAVLLAALTCLGAGHLRGWPVAGEIGLALVAESIVTASVAWVSGGWTAAVFGLGVAAFYLLWLARFWDQQLDRGAAWTTAGRLIPAARHLAWAAAAGAFGVALGGYLSVGMQSQSVWLEALTTFVLLVAMSLSVRDAGEHGGFGSALAACLLVVAATWPAGGLLSGLAASAISPVVLIAGGFVLLGIRAAAVPRTAAVAAVYNASIGGIVPVLVLLALSRRSVDLQSVAALVVGVVAVIVRVGTGRASSQVVAAPEAGRT